MKWNGRVLGLRLTSTLQQLQRVQNNLARVVCGVSKSQRPSEELLHELHWLPIRQRIHYEIAIITYRHWIYNHQVTSHHYWWTTSTSDPSFHQSRTAQHTSFTNCYWRQTFFICCSIYLEQTNYNVPSAETIGIFRTRLNTHLFPVIAS